MLIPITPSLSDSPNSFFSDFPQQLARHLPGTALVPFDKLEEHISQHNTVLCIRGAGMEKVSLFANKRVIVYFDDLQYWNKHMLQTKLACFQRADKILLPYYKQFVQMQEYSAFVDKAVFFPFYAPEAAFKFNDIHWQDKQDKALMTGRATPPYPFRRHIVATSNDLIDILQHPGYFNQRLHDIVGEKYYAHIASYKGGIVTSATSRGTFEYIGTQYDPACYREFNLNYTLAKYFEIPACGVVPFIEQTPDLEDLGFKHGDNCVLITPTNYLDMVQKHINDEALAKRARNFVLERHMFANRLEILKTVL